MLLIVCCCSTTSAAQPASLNGLGNPAAYGKDTHPTLTFTHRTSFSPFCCVQGIRTLVSDGEGLFFGMANPMNLAENGGWELKQAPLCSLVGGSASQISCPFDLNTANVTLQLPPNVVTDTNIEILTFAADSSQSDYVDPAEAGGTNHFRYLSLPPLPSPFLSCF